MQTFKKGFKQYLRARADQVLSFVKDEASRNPPGTLGEFESLSPFDLSGDVCFLIHLDSRVVGFATMRFITDTERKLTRIYVTPNARRYGCASFVIRGMKLTKVNIPVRHIQLVRLCLKQGFKYNIRQSYPDQVAELSRAPIQRKAYATSY